MVLNTENIRKRVVFLHGISGAGKSVLQKQVEDELKSKGITPRYLSSGDCFRKLASNPDISAKMARGEFIATLKDIEPYLKDEIELFLRSFANASENSGEVLILDGFLRIGEYINGEGKKIPSQIDQIANVFGDVLEEMCSKPKDIEIDLSLQNLVYNLSEPHVDFDGRLMEKFNCLNREIVVNSHHYYVDVTPEDAEALMRFRSEKDLVNILKKIDWCGGEKVFKFRKEIEKALAIQSGKFQIVEGTNRRVVEIDTTIEGKYSLKPTPKACRSNLDEHMNRVIREVAHLAGMDRFDDNLSLSKAVKVFMKENGFNPVSLRDDDLTYKSRNRRICEFQDKTIEGLLIKELGFCRYKSDEDILVPGRETGMQIILNGPGRGVSYELLNAYGYVAAGQLYREIRGNTGRIVGIENMLPPQKTSRKEAA